MKRVIILFVTLLLCISVTPQQAAVWSIDDDVGSSISTNNISVETILVERNVTYQAVKPAFQTPQVNVTKDLEWSEPGQAIKNAYNDYRTDKNWEMSNIRSWHMKAEKPQPRKAEGLFRLDVGELTY